MRDQRSLIGLHEFIRLPVAYPPGQPYEPEVEHLARRLRHDVPVRASVFDGAQAVAVALAIQQAIRERRPVAVEQLWAPSAHAAAG